MAQRWWEIERIEQSQGIKQPLLSVDELLQLENRIVIDTRSFADYSQMHFKGSFNMPPDPSPADLQTYTNFTRSYHAAYPDHLMVFLGDKKQSGTQIATYLIQEAAKTKVCLLKGGIDALKLEAPHLLRKGSTSLSSQGMLSHFERFISKASAMI